MTEFVGRTPFFAHTLGLFTGTFVDALLAIRTVDLAGSPGINVSVVVIAFLWLLASIVVLVLFITQVRGLLISDVMMTLCDAVATQDTVTLIRSAIHGDSSYGTAKFVEAIEGAGAEANVKVQPPSAPEGKFAKDAFDIDLTNNTVRCPAGMLVVIRSSTDGADGLRLASFGVRCTNCELRSQCTDALSRDAPKVERKIGHLMQRRHGGRCARHLRGAVGAPLASPRVANRRSPPPRHACGVRHQPPSACWPPGRRASSRRWPP